MKELPYFRFTVQEWQNGDITLEDFHKQGVYINACCYYWLSDCSITRTKLLQRLNDGKDTINLLCRSGHLKWNEETDEISISFLDDQWEMLSDMRKKRQKAGKKGGKQKASKAKAKLKQSPSYNDKDNKKDNDYSKDSFEVRISEFLFSFLLKKNPNHKKPNIQTWASHINKMIEIDKREPKQIGIVIKWCQEDSFWAPNIMSTSKLREKFDQLVVKMNSDNKHSDDNDPYSQIKTL